MTWTLAPRRYEAKILVICMIVGAVVGASTSGESSPAWLTLVVPGVTALVGGALCRATDWWAAVPFAVSLPMGAVWLLAYNLHLVDEDVYEETPMGLIYVSVLLVLFLCVGASALGAGSSYLWSRLMLGPPSP